MKYGGTLRFQGCTGKKSGLTEENTRPRKPRADTIRNREALVSAARRVFAGDNGSLEAVAREAGVGIGTLYRHFPTRESLFEAVYVREVEVLEEMAQGCSLPDWMRGALAMMATKRGMKAALEPAFDPDSTFFSEQAERMRAALDALRLRAVAEGALRPEVSADDLMRVLLGLSYGPGADPARAGMLLDVFLDGLTPR